MSVGDWKCNVGMYVGIGNPRSSVSSKWWDRGVLTSGSIAPFSSSCGNTSGRKFEDARASSAYTKIYILGEGGEVISTVSL